MKELALGTGVLVLIAILAGCAAPLPPEPKPASSTEIRQPTKQVPWRWTEERLVRNDEHDDLIAADGTRIHGVPFDQ